jgi:foldase protein PrsA
MEPYQTSEEKVETSIVKETSVSHVTATMKRLPLLYSAIAVAVLFVIIAFLFTRGFIVAATVNGSPISRLAVIEQLETQGGKQALEAMVDKKLIETELAKGGISLEGSDVDTKIKEIEAQVATQGDTLEEALASQGMTMEQLRAQLETQLKLEKLLAEKVQVTPEEVEAYITENKITPPKDVSLEEVKIQVTEQLKQEKFQAEAQKWVADITEKANIKYYVTY